MAEHDAIPEVLHENHVAIPEADWLGRVIDRLGLVFAVGLLVSMLILIQEVLLSYVFNAPTIWAHETTVFLCGAAFIFGGLYCTAKDRHIRVVLLYDIAPPGMRRALDVVISLICAICTGFFTWASWLMVQRSAFAPDGAIRLERSGSAWDPVYPGVIKIMLMVVMAIMTVQFLILAYNYARKPR